MAPRGVASPIQTVPTGFASLPPVGPAMPVVASPEIGSGAFAHAGGHCQSRGLAHRPLRLQGPGGNPQQRLFGAVGVGHGRQQEVVRAAGDIGEAMGEESAGAALRHGQRRPFFAQELAHDGLQAIAFPGDEGTPQLVGHPVHTAGQLGFDTLSVGAAAVEFSPG